MYNKKEKKVTKKAQRETCKQNVESLTKGLNEAGADVLKTFSYYNETDSYYSVNLNDSLDKKLDDMPIDILGELQLTAYTTALNTTNQLNL